MCLNRPPVLLFQKTLIYGYAFRLQYECFERNSKKTLPGNNRKLYTFLANRLKNLSDGYAFRFKAASQMILEAAEFIACERLCCPFFNFELAIEQDTNRLWLPLARAGRNQRIYSLGILRLLK